jgi:hypothetical protein
VRSCTRCRISTTAGIAFRDAWPEAYDALAVALAWVLDRKSGIRMTSFRRLRRQGGVIRCRVTHPASFGASQRRMNDAMGWSGGLRCIASTGYRSGRYLLVQDYCIARLVFTFPCFLFGSWRCLVGRMAGSCIHLAWWFMSYYIRDVDATRPSCPAAVWLGIIWSTLYTLEN